MKFLTQGKTNWKYVIIFAVVSIVFAFTTLMYLANISNYNSIGEPEKTADVTQEAKKSTSKQVSIPSKVLSYNEAILQYKDRRIQFGPDCSASPSYATFKAGTKIMLDNRYDKVRPIYLDGQKYSIEAYGFRIVTLSTSAKLPHTINIDCGTGKNNGRILLQQ